MAGTHHLFQKLPFATQLKPINMHRLLILWLLSLFNGPMFLLAKAKRKVSLIQHLILLWSMELSWKPVFVCFYAILQVLIRCLALDLFLQLCLEVWVSCFLWCFCSGMKLEKYLWEMLSRKEAKKLLSGKII